MKVAVFAQCAFAAAAENNEALSQTFDAWLGAGAIVAERGLKFAGGSLASRGLTGSGYATSSNAALVGRWLVNKSWRFDSPLLVQGIKVGVAPGGAALSGTALVAGVATNVLAAAAVQAAFTGGTLIGSGLVGLATCTQ